MKRMDDICKALSSLNNSDSSTKRHLIVVAFDHVNHGTRLVNKRANFGWKQEPQENPTHAFDMWSMVQGSSATVSTLIDVLEYYIFEPQEQSRVEVWGVIGFSLGGHTSLITAANDPRLTVVIPIVGTADMLNLIQSRLDECQLPQQEYFPLSFRDIVRRKTQNMHESLKSTKLLIINGEKDTMVPASTNFAFVDRLRKSHQGKEGQDWNFVVVPGVGHQWCQEMVDLSLGWCDKWMLRMDNSKL
ncbi:hypothetical protein DFQ28_008925 [Apophysomyces sp. BC1034]|nr:hypothetical protein DFQ30_008565 [Apophysomyces sp. BC1015]KAG0174342.1 hypothetical protein DFQ29_007533 [Apophysomyces sp. BC1021]KAG0185729.1 hypothetical protein DFQ28_008925 [Apophysomyces sp. BC1034]